MAPGSKSRSPLPRHPATIVTTPSFEAESTEEVPFTEAQSFDDIVLECGVGVHISTQANLEVGEPDLSTPEGYEVELALGEDLREHPSEELVKATRWRHAPAAS